MNITKLSAIASFAALTAASFCANAGNTFVYGNTSSWTIRTDPEHQYRCFAEVEYVGGTAIRLGYNTASAGLYLSVSDTLWDGIAANSKQVAAIDFDDEASFELRGTGISRAPSSASGGVLLEVPTTERDTFLAGFMARHTMTVAIEGAGQLDLSLAGSARAARMLEECQVAMAEQGSSAN